MYLVIELQGRSGALQHLVSVHEALAAAESKYHAVLSAAAVSAVPVHAAVLLGAAGNVVKTECYRHGTEGGGGA